MPDGNALLALTIGLGGGLAVAYLLREDEAPALPESAKSQAPARTPANVERNCSLRLDANGLTADGQTIDVPGAVARCKAAGRAEFLFTKDGPAAVYADLYRAISRAGLRVRVGSLMP